MIDGKESGKAMLGGQIKAEEIIMLRIMEWYEIMHSTNDMSMHKEGWKTWSFYMEITKVLFSYHIQANSNKLVVKYNFTNYL